MHRLYTASRSLPTIARRVWPGQRSARSLRTAQPCAGRPSSWRRTAAAVRPGQQAEQLFQRQLTLGIDPALLDQWRCRPTWTADLPVVQFAGAEQRALAHHHAHQQCLRRLRQQSETPDEGAFGVVQQVAMMLVHPGQNLLKVVEIVEGVFQGPTHRTSGKTGAARPKAGYLYSSEFGNGR